MNMARKDPRRTRARSAGFDTIYVYAGHDLNALLHLVSRRRNHRTDAYGDSLENPIRLQKQAMPFDLLEPRI